MKAFSWGPREQNIKVGKTVHRAAHMGSRATGLRDWIIPTAIGPGMQQSHGADSRLIKISIFPTECLSVAFPSPPLSPLPALLLLLSLFKVLSSLYWLQVLHIFSTLKCFCSSNESAQLPSSDGKKRREERWVYKELLILNVLQASNAGQRESHALGRQYKENKQTNFSQE